MKFMRCIHRDKTKTKRGMANISGSTKPDNETMNRAIVMLGHSPSSLVSPASITKFLTITCLTVHVGFTSVHHIIPSSIMRYMKMIMEFRLMGTTI